MWVRETCIDQQQKAPEGNHSQQFNKLSSAFSVCVFGFFCTFLPLPHMVSILLGNFYNTPTPISIVPYLYKVFTKIF